MTIEADLANLPIPILPIVAETGGRTDWLAPPHIKSRCIATMAALARRLSPRYPVMPEVVDGDSPAVLSRGRVPEARDDQAIPRVLWAVAICARPAVAPVNG